MKPFRSGISGNFPEGWVFRKESITLESSDKGANVICSTEHLETPMTSEEFALFNGELLSAQFPGYSEITLQPLPVFGDHPGYLRIFHWFPEDGEPVYQAQIYLTSENRSFTATATARFDEHQNAEDLLLQILDDLRIER